MSLYTASSLLAQRDSVSTFRAEEAQVTFFKEADYLNGDTLRADMTPVGLYFYYTGLSADETTTLLPPQQAVGYTHKNLKVAAYTESKVTINGLYTQEGADLTWLLPGGEPLVLFIDFIDASGMNTHLAGNILDTYHRVVETWTIRDARVTERRIAFQDASSVSYSVSFTAGVITRLWSGPSHA